MTIRPVSSSVQFGAGRFQKFIRKATLGATLAAGILGVSGCSPQVKSYWSGTYTNLPKPPASARAQLSISTEEDGTVFITYITWNGDKNRFERKDTHYTTTTLSPGTFSEAGGYVQEVRSGEVLAGGIIVDQKAKKLILPNGNFVDGPSGNILDKNNKIIQKFGEE